MSQRIGDQRVKDTGVARLQLAEDNDKLNRFDKPVIGWHHASQGEGSIVNQNIGMAVMMIVVQKMFDNGFEDLYNQPMMVQNVGTMVVCKSDDDRVMLIQSYRMNADRLAGVSANYVRTLNEQGRWEELLASLGSWKWELPAGLAPPGEADDLEAFILKTAAIEALEESGVRICNPQNMGRLNFDPAFFMHSQYVVQAEIAHIGDPRIEQLEIIGKRQLFSGSEIRALIDAGQMDDCRSIGALALAGFRF